MGGPSRPGNRSRGQRGGQRGRQRGGQRGGQRGAQRGGQRGSARGRGRSRGPQSRGSGAGRGRGPRRPPSGSRGNHSNAGRTRNASGQRGGSRGRSCPGQGEDARGRRPGSNNRGRARGQRSRGGHTSHSRGQHGAGGHLPRSTRGHVPRSQQTPSRAESSIRPRDRPRAGNYKVVSTNNKGSRTKTFQVIRRQKTSSQGQTKPKVCVRYYKRVSHDRIRSNPVFVPPVLTFSLPFTSMPPASLPTSGYASVPKHAGACAVTSDLAQGDTFRRKCEETSRMYRTHHAPAGPPPAVNDKEPTIEDDSLDNEEFPQGDEDYYDNYYGESDYDYQTEHDEEEEHLEGSEDDYFRYDCDVTEEEDFTEGDGYYGDQAYDDVYNEDYSDDFNVTSDSSSESEEEGDTSVLQENQPKVAADTFVERTEQKLPGVCNKYNTKDGCDKGAHCQYMHVCKHFTLFGNCRFGSRCRSGHNLYECQPRGVLERSGIDTKQEHDDLCKLYQLQTDAAKGKKVKTRIPREDMPVEICTYHLRGACDFGESCHSVHTELPYLWQVQLPAGFTGKDPTAPGTQSRGQNEHPGDHRGPKWQNIPQEANVQVEEKYCNPQNEEISLNCKIDDSARDVKVHINFEKMTGLWGGSSVAVRRLSTSSYVTSYVTGSCPLTSVPYTKWRWFYLDHSKQWQDYDKSVSEPTPMSQKGRISWNPVISRSLEEALADEAVTAEVKMEGGKVRVDTRRMAQAGPAHGTPSIPVRRRPVFVSPENLNALLCQTKREVDKNSLVASSGGCVPDHWDEIIKEDSEEEEECVLIEIENDEEDDAWAEYLTIEEKFHESMSRELYYIHRICRIQNAELWDRYSRNKEWKEKKTGRGQKELMLFHGTSRENVDGICQQGFDWRIAGSSVGTRFGKGSYFSTTASFAKDYSSGRHVFVVRVLVGESALGDSEMVKPPPRNPKQPKGLTYDSCVNSLENPTMYVIFERERAYPEYLIKYKKVKQK